uniref:Uncharacterized protein n=1 Tax=Arundo donax TaxID=35708 RepID=A0A0A9HL38_ARUDO
MSTIGARRRNLTGKPNPPPLSSRRFPSLPCLPSTKPSYR